jgi:iron complex transport system substrate-binding protein
MFRKLILVLIPCVFIFSACVTPSSLTPAAVSTKASTAVTSINLTDGLGRVITLPGPARSIISLAASNTEIIYAVGAGSQLVGRDSFSDYPESAKSVQDIGGSMGKYNSELIVALHPDLILAGEINPPELVGALEQLGLKVFFLSNPSTLEGMYVNIETVARLTGHTAEAGLLLDALELRVAVIDKKIKPLSSAPSVYYELDASDPTKPYTAGPGSFMDMLIRRAGGVNVGAELKGEWAQISLEELLVQNPNFLILGDSAYGETPEKVAARPGWNALTAVKTRQVFPFDDNLVSRPGPRWVDGLEALAKLLHPGLFN